MRIREDSSVRRFVAAFLLAMPAAFALIAPMWAAPAWAEDKYDVARRQYPELFQVYYDANVMEYCGLITEESAGGFRQSRDVLVTRDLLTEDQNRDVRISAAIAADLEYQDRGLGGYKGWCRTEGKGAYDRFIAAYGADHAVNP